MLVPLIINLIVHIVISVCAVYIVDAVLHIPNHFLFVVVLNHIRNFNRVSLLAHGFQYMAADPIVQNQGSTSDITKVELAEPPNCTNHHAPPGPVASTVVDDQPGKTLSVPLRSIGIWYV